MMTGWIVYYREDYDKNRKFIEMCEEAFAKYKVNLDTKILEEVNYKNLPLPDFAINRSRDYVMARYLEQKGVRVFNSSKVTEIANDKYETYRLLDGVVDYMPVSLKSEGIPYPKVIKSLSGHGGTQVFLAQNQEEEKEAILKLGKDKYLFQGVSSDLGKDVRVYIIGNNIVAAVLRTSNKSFKSNFSLGGKVSPYKLNEHEINMVKAIIKKLPMDYAGIDFIFHNNQAVFNEIEDAVGARMLYQVSSIDIIYEYVKYIINEMC